MNTRLLWILLAIVVASAVGYTLYYLWQESIEDRKEQMLQPRLFEEVQEQNIFKSDAEREEAQRRIDASKESYDGTSADAKKSVPPGEPIRTRHAVSPIDGKSLSVYRWPKNDQYLDQDKLSFES